MTVQTKTTIEVKLLAHALSFLTVSNARKTSALVNPQLPITEALYLSGDDGVLSLRRGVLKLRFDEVPSDLSARLVPDITKQIKTFSKNSSAVLSEGSENSLEVSSGKRSFTLKGSSPEDFPVYPEASKGSTVAIYDAAELLKALDRSAPYMRSDDTRPVLAGTNFEFSSDSTQLVATDTYRMIKHSLSGLADDELLSSAIIPGGDLALLRKLLKKTIGSVELLAIDPSHGEIYTLIFTGSTESFDYELTTRVVNGNYPEWRRLWPVESNLEIAEVDRTALESAIKAAQVMSHANAPIIPLRFEFQTDSVEILLDSELGNFSESIDGISEYSGSIAINPQYALEAIQAFDSDTVQIGIQPYTDSGYGGSNGFAPGYSNKPAIISGDVLLMPMRYGGGN